MKYFMKVLLAESYKQHRNYFNNRLIYVSLFVWPMFSFLAAYYSYRAFDFGGNIISYISTENILVFILLGYMAMSFFRSVVQSAWNFSRERQSGTLEYIYLSPANRLAVLLGNALSSVFESAVVMFIFGMLIILFNRSALNVNIVGLILVLAIFMVMALLWGVFLNACFLYSRDTDFLFTILEEPMEIFAGVKVPVVIFPGWARIISCIFPLTYVLEALRQVSLNAASISSIKTTILISLVIIMVLLGATLITIQIVEKHMRKTGNVVLF
ncbi:ABC transporter permease [Pseudobutyrivibrio ruminis]|uniref:ABC transporter permease n=1 Tax=Pseudobutyrivibrio ruminis TaxID=46206 RepID=UPI00040C26AF|nr:ABC transporter permease [Pseudobutyrivibrio ruminis]